ncbi:uncharacterized protein LOC121354687 [Pyrgilauda ruficollis]|uniref:uncharacterized protein LOC121354687 n=1 Tax=Pyrgilauda ruficollis TaxID=221976 RepID=UPI001B87B92A|nr:uncharacterized protein LOC121354687 [Pyrgilauda ruficollis]
MFFLLGKCHPYYPGSVVAVSTERPLLANGAGRYRQRPALRNVRSAPESRFPLPLPLGLLRRRSRDTPGRERRPGTRGGVGLRLDPPPRRPRRERCLRPHPRHDGQLRVGFVLLRSAARCLAMSLCRTASQALASLLSRVPSAASRLKQRAPPRQMSSGSVPGSSRDSMMIYLLAGVAVGGLFYAYRVVSSPRSKFVEHKNILHERAEGQKSNPWSRKEGDGEEVDEVTGAEKTMEEADAAASVEPAAQDERAGPTAQDETSGVSPEAGGENDLLAPEVSHAVEEAQQEAPANSEAAANLELAANSEAAAVQVSEEEKTTEEVGKEP